MPKALLRRLTCKSRVDSFVGKYGIVAETSTSFAELVAAIRIESPNLSEARCLSASRHTLAVVGLCGGVLAVVDAILESWHGSDGKPSWWALSYLHEVAGRIFGPDPPVERHVATKRIRPFASREQLLRAIEKTFKTHACFLLERYRRERTLDWQVRLLWLELLTYIGSDQMAVCDEVIRAIEEVDHSEVRLRLFNAGDRAFAAAPEWLTYLERNVQASRSDLVRFFSFCLLAGAGRVAAPQIYCAALSPLRHADWGLPLILTDVIGRLPDELFFDVIAAIIGDWPLPYISIDFELIRRGFQRLFHDSRDYQGCSASTSRGYEEIWFSIRPVRPGHRPQRVSKGQAKFLQALVRNDDVWQVRTDFWELYGLPSGRSDLERWMVELGIEAAGSPLAEDENNYLEMVQSALMRHGGGMIPEFTAADGRLASQWYKLRIPAMQVERAILLGCTEKYAAARSQPHQTWAGSLQEFARYINEAGRPDLSEKYWKSVELRLRRMKSQDHSERGRKWRTL